MATLADTVDDLERALDALDDVTSQDRLARALTEITADIERHRKRLRASGAVYTDQTLPGPAGVDIARWETTLGKLKALQERLELSPETVRDGRLWTDTDATLKSLVRDLDADVAARWSRVQPCSDELDTRFLAGLPPGTSGVDRYREVVTELRGLFDRAIPQVGDARRATQLLGELRLVRAELRKSEPPEALKRDLALLAEGRLPLDRYQGDLQTYLERAGLTSRLRLGLRSE